MDQQSTESIGARPPGRCWGRDFGQNPLGLLVAATFRSDRRERTHRGRPQVGYPAKRPIPLRAASSLCLTTATDFEGRTAVGRELLEGSRNRNPWTSTSLCGAGTSDCSNSKFFISDTLQPPPSHSVTGVVSCPGLHRLSAALLSSGVVPSFPISGSFCRTRGL